MASRIAPAAQSTTTTIQDARATVTGCMLPEMADNAIPVRSALGYLAQLQPGLKGAAVFTADGALEACEGPEQSWLDYGTGLLRMIESTVEQPPTEAHIATAAGEVFMVSLNGRRLVAVAERFVLASLLTFDMRTVLREIEAGS